MARRQVEREEAALLGQLRRERVGAEQRGHDRCARTAHHRQVERQERRAWLGLRLGSGLGSRGWVTLILHHGGVERLGFGLGSGLGVERQVRRALASLARLARGKPQPPEHLQSQD